MGSRALAAAMIVCIIAKFLSLDVANAQPKASNVSPFNGQLIVGVPGVTTLRPSGPGWKASPHGMPDWSYQRSFQSTLRHANKASRAHCGGRKCFRVDPFRYVFASEFPQTLDDGTFSDDRTDDGQLRSRIEGEGTFIYDWIPVDKVLNGEALLARWNAEAVASPSCSGTDCTTAIRIQHGPADAGHSIHETLHRCKAVVLAPGVEGFLGECDTMAVWDGKRVWVRGILGLAVEEFDIELFRPGERVAYERTSWRKIPEITNDAIGQPEYTMTVSFSSGASALRGKVRTAALAAVATTPLSMTTKTTSAAVYGIGLKGRVSPVLAPKREWVTVTFTFVESDDGEEVGIDVALSIFVNRLNNDDAVDWHAPTTIEEGQYHSAVRKALAAQIARLCSGTWLDDYNYRCSEAAPPPGAH